MEKFAEYKDGPVVERRIKVALNSGKLFAQRASVEPDKETGVWIIRLMDGIPMGGDRLIDQLHKIADRER